MNPTRIVAVVLAVVGVLTVVSAAITYHLDETDWVSFSDRMHRVGNVILLAALFVFLIDVVRKRSQGRSAHEQSKYRP